MKVVSVVVVAAILSACVTGRQPPPSPPRRSELGLGISTYTLANGLRVVLVRDPRAPGVQVTTRYRVGSVDDGSAPGIAHMAEHLMFQQVLGSQTLYAQLEQIATYFNAMTTYDATTYISRAPREHLDRLLSIEGVRLGLRCTSITDAVFAREREVVVNEVRLRDDATELVGALHAAAYPQGHPYRNSIGGNVESLSAMTREQVCAFVDKHYAPSNAVLVVSGNVSQDELDGSLRKLVARIAKREVVAQAYVPPLVTSGQRADSPAPIDDDALLVVWSLPASPLARTQMQTVAKALPTLIEQRIAGSVEAITLGDTRAQSLAFVVVPSMDTTIEKVRVNLEAAILSLPTAFSTTRIEELDQLTFDAVRQSATHGLYSSLEDGRSRDIQLATYVFEGREPTAALAEEFDGIRQLDSETAIAVAKHYLDIDRANIITLKASGKRSGGDVSVRPPVHDMGPRRSDPDVTEARRPATLETYRPTALTRQLSNGMRVVLLPTSTVPTVDIRLVFASGTADEAPDKRGVSLISAYGLDWNFGYLNDLLLFAAAGGKNSVDIDEDHTTFSAAGVDMHLDFLLAGLRRWVRDGRYHVQAPGLAHAVRRDLRRDRNRPVEQAWLEALYGASHPYTLAEMSVTITDADVDAFRRDHYTPDNATLVIAGHFDPALANQWIDYLFDDWRGQSSPRAPAPPPTSEAASLALIDDVQQLQVLIALPATTKSRAKQLVAAAILEDVAGDVRHTLGATYGISAALEESRLTTRYELDGWIDAARAPEAMKLLTDRLAQLRRDPSAAARAFVTARNRVLVRLTPTTSHGLAYAVERDVSLARTPLSAVETAAEVRALTIDDMTDALADLDLVRATMFFHGSKVAVDQAFAAIGRTPRLVERMSLAAMDNLDEDEQEVKARKREDIDLGYALTEHGPKLGRWLLTLAPTLVSGKAVGKNLNENVESVACCSGVGAIAEIGRSLDRKMAVGLRLSTSFESGHRKFTFQPKEYAVDVSTYSAAAFIRTIGYDRLWASVFVGLHIDNLAYQTFDLMTLSESHTGVALGLEAGVDILKLSGHRLGVMTSVAGAMPSGYASFSLGLAYRL